jgi:predicted flavoprotein YhiN
MLEFAETVASSKIRQRLYKALNGSKKVFRRFKDVLDDYPEERDRYYKFLRKYCEEQIIQWLKEEDIDMEMTIDD